MMHLRSNFALASAVALGLSLLSSAGWAAETIDVRLGYSELVRTEQPAETVIVGNDQVANATIAAQRTIVVTGISLGSTNLILLDQAGAEIASKTVRVVPVDPRPQRAVRLISGGAAEEARVYHCGPAPGCSPSRDVVAGSRFADQPADTAENGEYPETETEPGR